MADLVKIRRVKGGTECVVDAAKAERLTSTKDWDMVDVKPAKAVRAVKAAAADPVVDPDED